MEENLTCSICMDVFRDPVTLPCSHSYCRECLQMFSDKHVKCKSAQSDDLNKSHYIVVIPCPLCRTPTDLGNEGVSGLAVNSDLAVSVSQADSGVHCEEDAPKCSMCDDDLTSAVTFCSTCVVWYCTECLGAMHPMKGPLKRHTLITVEEYFAKKGRSDSSKYGCADGDPELLCDSHSQPFSLYCVTCQQLICLDCLSEHNKHQMSDVESAFETEMVIIKKKTKDCQDLLTKVDQCTSEIETLKNEIQCKEDCHLGEVERAYNSGAELLNALRRKHAESIRQRHRKWRDDCDGAFKDLTVRRGELEDWVRAADKLSSKVKYLKWSRSLQASGLDDQLGDLTGTLEVKADMIKTCRDSLKHELVTARSLSLIELVTARSLSLTEQHRQQFDSISTPVLMFSWKYRPRIGSVKDAVIPVSPPSSVCMPGNLQLTNKGFQTGQHYWEIDIQVKRLVPGDTTRWSCTAGVVKEFYCKSKNGKFNIWGISLAYANKIATWQRQCAEEFHKISSKGSKTGTEANRIGFYLDCNKQMLVVIDCCRNQVIVTFKDMKTSQRLIPVVGVLPVTGGTQTVAAHLVPCDRLIVPDIVSDVM